LLERHVIDRRNKREELFGYYLDQLLIPAIPGYTYSEKDEAKNGYKETSKIISTDQSASIYDNVRQLATAAWHYGAIIDGNDTSTRDVGITYGNGEVMLIRAVSYDGGNFFHTAYPNYRGKLLYESKIK
jgi:hypothetical protein